MQSDELNEKLAVLARAAGFDLAGLVALTEPESPRALLRRLGRRWPCR